MCWRIKHDGLGCRQRRKIDIKATGGHLAQPVHAVVAVVLGDGVVADIADL